MDEKQKKSQKLEIELSKEEASGTYSNLVMITHSSSEFIFDFVSVMPGVPKAKVQKRMVLAPEHAKRLANALNDNIKRYEEANGTINLKGKQEEPPPINYRGPLPEA